MEQTIQKKKSKKALKIFSGILAVVVLAALVSIWALWHNELATLTSMQMLRQRDDSHKDGAVYTMNVRGGFYLDEFVARGGAKTDKELISFVTDQITHGLIPIKIEDPEIGCSSFTAQSAQGDRLFARNYDMTKTNTCIVITEKTPGRHATISTVDLQFLGMDVNRNLSGLMEKITCLAAPYAPLDGINDAGLSCGIYMTYQGGEKTIATNQNTELPDITSTTLIRLILDYADTVEDAVALAQSYDMHDSANTSYHYMIADASGKSAILEWSVGTDATDNDGSQRTLHVLYPDADDAVGPMEAKYRNQVITNFVLQPGYYDGVADSEKKGADRYAHIWTQLDANGGQVADDQAAMDILASVGRRDWGNDDSNGITVHSAVFNLTQKTVTWVPNERYEDPSAWFVFGFDK